jgi:hypothetical protein
MFGERLGGLLLRDRFGARFCLLGHDRGPFLSAKALSFRAKKSTAVYTSNGSVRESAIRQFIGKSGEQGVQG